MYENRILWEVATPKYTILKKIEGQVQQLNVFYDKFFV